MLFWSVFNMGTEPSVVVAVPCRCLLISSSLPSPKMQRAMIKSASSKDEDSDAPQEEEFDRRNLLKNNDAGEDEDYPQEGMDDEISAYRKKLLEKNRNEPKPLDTIKSEEGTEVYRFQPPTKKMKSQIPKGPSFASRLKKYSRGEGIDASHIENKKLKNKIARGEKLASDAVRSAARAEILLQAEPGLLESEDPMRKTSKFTQVDIRREVDIASANKIYDLDLKTFGPYKIDYSRNGRHLLIGGRKGHVALMDWQTKHLLTELHLKETVRDIKFFHNHSLFAVAQKKYTYVYDSKGVEIHCLEKHMQVNRIEFLPYHFLLCTIGKNGVLKYQDVSTGELIAEHRTKLGPCDTMSANPTNAIIHLGHHDGVVTMWSPNVTTPLVRMLCHRAGVTSISVDPTGRHMVTTGRDCQVRVWDLRTYQPLHTYYAVKPVHSASISQRGLLAVAYASTVQVWKDALSVKVQSPYMEHDVGSPDVIEDISFVPYEDVLGIGRQNGVSSILVPGSGEPNVDIFEANPYETHKQRKEFEVHQLLEKLPAAMITMDPNAVGRVDKTPKEHIAEEKRKEAIANASKKQPVEVKKKRRTSAAKRKLLLKEKNIWDQKKAMLEEQQNRQKEKKDREERKRKISEDGAVPSALDRFNKGK